MSFGRLQLRHACALVVVLAIAAGVLWRTAFALSGGATPDKSNNPWGNPLQAPVTCTRAGCHATQGGVGAGSVAVTGLPQCYVCGQTYELTVTIADNDQTRKIWGFEIGIQYKDNDPTFDTRGAGTLDNAAGARTQKVQTDGLDGSGVRQFITHDPLSANGDGTYDGQLNGASWKVKWTAPACDERNSNVRVYVAGLAGNSNGTVSGDRTYNATYDVPPCVVPTKTHTWGSLKGTTGR